MPDGKLSARHGYESKAARPDRRPSFVVGVWVDPETTSVREPHLERTILVRHRSGDRLVHETKGRRRPGGVGFGVRPQNLTSLAWLELKRCSNPYFKELTIDIDVDDETEVQTAPGNLETIEG